MSTPSITLWGIHAGETGDAETLFFQENQVALGWSATVDEANSVFTSLQQRAFRGELELTKLTL